MNPLEKARAVLKNLPFIKRLVIMNGVGSVLYWTEHYTKERLIHVVLSLVPVWFATGLLLRGTMGDENNKLIALLLAFVTVPMGFVFHFSGRAIVKSNRFIMENLSAFQRVYFEYLLAYYVFMLIIAFVIYACFF